MENKAEEPVNLYYRQGEVILKRVDTSTDWAGFEKKHWINKKELLNDPVLAKGSGGHSHTLVDCGAIIRTFGPTYFVALNSGTKLVHPEHAELILKPGIYQVDIQRELDSAGLESFVYD